MGRNAASQVHWIGKVSMQISGSVGGSGQGLQTGKPCLSPLAGMPKAEVLEAVAYQPWGQTSWKLTVLSSKVGANSR